MTSREFRITETASGKYLFEGVLDIHQADRLKEFLQVAAEDGGLLEISFAGLQYIDICALQVLISFKRSPRVATRLQIADVSTEVREVLAVCGLQTTLFQ